MTASGAIPPPADSAQRALLLEACREAKERLGPKSRYVSPEVPGTRGEVRIEVADFEAAVRDWEIPWPQHHDGLGFETPLAGLFAIPSEPHWAVVSPEGKVVFLGSDDENAFRRALSN